MSNIPHEEKIKKDYESYHSFINSKKEVVSPFVVEDARKEHPSSLCATKELTCELSYGKIELYSEVKKANTSNYSLSIKSDVIDSRILLRYDSDGPTHKNSVDYIPLEDQSVPTPHFHKFDEQGNLLAYQTDKLKNEKEVNALKNIEFGFAYFCQNGYIYKNKTMDLPEIWVNNGMLPLDYNEDPTNGINFE